MIFTNSAALSYNNITQNSNVVSGALQTSLSVAKEALSDSYRPGGTVFYTGTVTNSSDTAYTGVTLTDDFGRYEWNGFGRFPIIYVYGSARLEIIASGGISEGSVSADYSLEGMIFTFDIPPQSTLILSYEAQVTDFASLSAGSSITNSVALSGAGQTVLQASETLTAAEYTDLQISKSICDASPTVGSVTAITLTLSNYGNTAAGADGDLMISDILSPYLTDISVTYNGEAWSEGAQYTYEQSTGLWQTTAGAVSLAPAAYARDNYGQWLATPSSSVITIRGTVAGEAPQAFIQTVAAYADGTEASFSTQRVNNALFNLSVTGDAAPAYFILADPQVAFSLISGTEQGFTLTGNLLTVDRGAVGPVTAVVYASYGEGGHNVQFVFTKTQV